jgi:beta-glucanase (GH16 family)
LHVLKSLIAFGACSLALQSGCSQPPEQSGTDYWAGPQGSSWQPLLVEEFDGPAGSAPNPATWNVEVDDSPFNQEKQAYTSRPSNVSLDGAGHLALTAQREALGASDLASALPYTSGRVNTKGLVTPQYGRIEARIKVPAGKGLWPAFWLLGQDVDTVGWPKCGEVDIFELGGSQPARITGSLHAPGYFAGSALHDRFTKEAGTFADDYHVYALEWAADGMRWLVDEQPYGWRTPKGLQSLYQTWAFDHPMFIILNLAVGGIYDGDPNAATPMPSTLLVDYVKVSKLVPAQ